jgi:hypothetical protein
MLLYGTVDVRIKIVHATKNVIMPTVRGMTVGVPLKGLEVKTTFEQQECPIANEFKKFHDYVAKVKDFLSCRRSKKAHLFDLWHRGASIQTSLRFLAKFFTTVDLNAEVLPKGVFLVVFDLVCRSRAEQSKGVKLQYGLNYCAIELFN